MNTSQIKNFAILSRNILKAGVLNRVLTLGFSDKGELIVDRPVKIQGGTVFMDQLREESFYDAWIALETRLSKHGIKEVCEEAAYTWFNRLVAIRIMQKNHFIEPVMQYVSSESRIPVIVDQARSGRLSLRMSAQDKAKLDDLLRDSTKTNEQFNLLISAFCQANPVIFNCFGGIEKHIALLLPDNILSQGGFIDLLNNTPYLTDEDYTKSELIGWLYQFYISEKKDEVFESFKKGKKAEAEDIPAATQIFTPNWIVKYMVENTIGRIYLDNNPYADEIKDSMKYLVEPSGSPQKAPILELEDLDKYKMLDNACGSGHILIESFNLFYRMYKYEGFSSRKAIENILTKNIIGLDLDTRAKQLATFSLLMTAAKEDKSFLDCKVMPRVLDFPDPFVYRDGTWEDFFRHYYLGCSEKVMKETLAAFELLEEAKSLGSIMEFDISAETRAAMEKATVEWGKRDFLPDDIVNAVKSMKVILALTDKYSAVCTNPPYMKAANMNDVLKEYIDIHYALTRFDMYSVFMYQCMDRVKENGAISMIVQPTWLVNYSFGGFREYMVDNYHIASLLHMGRGNFGNDWGSIAFTLRYYHSNEISHFFKLYERTFYRIETEHISTIFLKAKRSKLYSFDFKAYSPASFDPDNSVGGKRIYYPCYQDGFKRVKNTPFCYTFSDDVIYILNKTNVASWFVPATGLQTGDNNRFIRAWHEISIKDKGVKWFPLVNGGFFRKWYGNFNDLIYWYNDGEEIRKCKGSVLRNQQYYKKSGITWNRIASKGIAIRAFPEGCLFDQAGDSMFGADLDKLYICMAYLNTKVAKTFFDMLAPTINLTAGMIGKLPYLSIGDSWQPIDLVFDCINISKRDWDAHETSWDFKVNELVRILKSDLIPHMRINGELQPDQAEITDLMDQFKLIWRNNFNKLHENEEELNRQFIEIYGLQDELSPDVTLDEITILQNGEISIENNEIVWHDDVLIKQLLSYAIGCRMGRYRLDKEGLNIAHYPSDEEICTYKYNGAQFEIDDDAIIPIMGGNNPFEDDNALQKIINFVRIVFGEENLTKNLNYIEHCLGKSLEGYLVKDFWKDHKKMYQNRPIYWLFSSKKGAFQVLTYMHRMNPYTVEKIRTKYLLPYIDYLKGRIEVDESRGSELSSVERANLAKMRAALDECNEYHDRLHEIAIQAIDFDLDDGVVVNYAKFGDVVAKIK